MSEQQAEQDEFREFVRDLFRDDEVPFPATDEQRNR